MIGFIVCLLAMLTTAYADLTQEQADKFLERTGYLDRTAKRAGAEVARTNAIAKFQRMYNLTVTGQLDEETQKLMEAPRCGVPDIRKKKTRSMGDKWSYGHLRWAYVPSTSQLSESVVRQCVKRALELWGSVTGLSFSEVPIQDKPEIEFSFQRWRHGDDFDFDGKVVGGRNWLAHAEFPEEGIVHWDDDELWAFDDAQKIQNGYTDFYWVTVHELGHALGVEHIQNDRNAIMFPSYQIDKVIQDGKLIPLKLGSSDIWAIQKFYGPKGGWIPPPTPEPTPGGLTGGQCPRFQSAVTDSTGSVHFFDGNIGYKKATPPWGASNAVTKFYADKRFPGLSYTGVTAAVLITERWFGVPGGLMVLFQGRRVFAYTLHKRRQVWRKRQGFPKDLPSNIPWTPQGAFFVPSAGHTIIYNGEDFAYYYPMENTANLGRDMTKSYYQNMPTQKASAAFNVGDREIYFIDATNYYVYDVDQKRVTNTQPARNLITC